MLVRIGRGGRCLILGGGECLGADCDDLDRVDVRALACGGVRIERCVRIDGFDGGQVMVARRR